VEETTHQVRAGLDEEWMEAEVPTTGGITPRAAGPDGDQTISIKDQLLMPLESAVRQSFELDIQERQFRLRVEHVGEPVSRKTHPAVDAGIGQEGIEGDERRIRDEVGFARSFGERLEDQGHRSA